MSLTEDQINAQIRAEHREENLLSRIDLYDGTQIWVKPIRSRSNAIIHREDGPAVIYRNGESQWWLDGVYYPEFHGIKKDGTFYDPRWKAIITTKDWLLHNENGPAVQPKSISRPEEYWYNGSRCTSKENWQFLLNQIRLSIKNGMYRDANGDSRWFQDGLLHSETGPAVRHCKGTTVWEEYWINGIKCADHKDWLERVERVRNSRFKQVAL